MTEIPFRVLQRFGNRRAKPRLTRVYHVSTGWQPAPFEGLLDEPTLQVLAAQGYTLAEGKWRWKTRQLSTSRRQG